MRASRAAWLVAVVAAVPAARAADDWPRMRGPDGAGAGGDVRIPAEWDDARWAWTVRLPGAGHASPIVFAGGIYTASADEAAKMRFVSRHRLDTGALDWQRELPGAIDPHHAQNSSASGTLAAGPLGVYWLWADHDGLRAEAFGHDGRPLWHADIGPYEGEHGFGASPAVWRDLLIVPNDQLGESGVLALDAATGAVRWRRPRGSAKSGFSTPLVIEGDDGRTTGAQRRPQVVLASMAHGIFGLDAATGGVMWERACLPKRSVSCPVIVGPGDRPLGSLLVVATCGDGGGDNSLVALHAPANDMQAAVTSEVYQPEIAYQIDRGAAPYVPTPLPHGERLYLWGDRGVVTCVSAATGEVRWRGRVGGTFSASPIVVGDTILNVEAGGEVVTLAAGDVFEVRGRRPLGEECRSTPAVAGRRVVFRSLTRLYAIDGAID